MGQLFCACNSAGLVVCSFCPFAVEHYPAKMYYAQNWIPKFPASATTPADQNGLDMLAEEIMAEFTAAELKELGINTQEGEE